MPDPVNLTADQHRTRRLPTAAIVVALLIAIMHLFPVWRAQIVTPDNWEFTGNLSRHSPDAMQYRAWFRQTQETGVLGENRFTTEANPPHLPLVFFYAVGKIANLLGVSPELVYAYAGALIAFVLTLLVFLVVRNFFTSTVQTWWVFLAALLGGGLGAYYKFIQGSETLTNLPGVWRVFVAPLQGIAVWEDYRGNYAIQALMDPHSGLQWMMVLSTVMVLYLAMVKPNATRLIVLAIMGSATTVVHMYAGITLLAIGGGIWLVNYLTGVARRDTTTSVLALYAGTVLTLGGLLVVYRNGGLPLPNWRAINVLFSILFIAYPLAWCLLAWGLPRYVRELDLDRSFILGWIAGCTALLLSGPFYAYPDRGSVTLQIPLTIVAGLVYFNRFPKVTPLAGLIAIILLGATPLHNTSIRWAISDFRSDSPTKFLDADHREILAELSERASRRDILLSRYPETLWLAPTYPGVHYAGHFFLTVDFATKIDKVDRFYAGTLEEPVKFLHEAGIRYVWVSAAQDPARFSSITGLLPRMSNTAGTLFEFRGTP